MSEAAARVTDLAILHGNACLRFSRHSVGEIGGAERYEDVGQVVLVKKGGVARWNGHTENADVFIFKDEMMMRLFGDGDGFGGLGVEGKGQGE